MQEPLAATLPPTHGDRIQLQQPIVNLMSNPVEAFSGVGLRGELPLQISTHRHQSQLALDVAQSSQEKMSESQHRFDDAEDRFESYRKSPSPALLVALAPERDRVVALARDCLTDNFTQDVSQGKLARLASVHRYHLPRFLDHSRPAHRSRSSASL